MTEVKKKPLKYTAIQSFVESSFFTRLSELKLNEFKLDSSRRPISSFMTNPKKLTKFNDKPIVNLDYSSFDGVEDDNSNSIWLSGHLYNVNTIEEFKNLDKLKLLKEWGKQIYDEIVLCTLEQKGQAKEQVHEERTKEAKTLEPNDPSSVLLYGQPLFAQLHQTLNQFYLLTFCDLKKYKFYSWFAFPTLHSTWVIQKTSNNNEYELEIEEYLKGTHSLPFFQIIDGEILNSIRLTPKGKFVYVDTSLSPDRNPSIQLKNYLYFLAHRGFTAVDLLIYRNDGNSYSLKLELENYEAGELPKMTGWERTNQGKLGPKLADLGSLINPNQLAEQAVDLNLKLMKWRIAPQLDLDIIKQQKVLLLGAGTLGSYVSRALMGWGVRNITFVDNGRISYSNPVRQPLFTFEDCYSDKGQGEWKALRAAKALQEIFPGVNSQGFNLEVPMIGHPVNDEVKQKENFDKLLELFDQHDCIFLLMDSRESRWLPTLLGLSKGKIVMNAALGFDSYLVMRHGNFSETAEDHDAERLGCYYCNDVVAPKDSLSDRTLDQMCTVTRPGVALMASSLVVELLVSILQHPKRQFAGPKDTDSLGEVSHQIRGYLHNFSQTKLHAPNYKYCSACSWAVVEEFRQKDWEFVKSCLNSSDYLEEVSGLKKVQQEADEVADGLIMDFDDFEDEDD